MNFNRAGVIFWKEMHLSALFACVCANTWPACTQESQRHVANKAVSCVAVCKYLTSMSRQEQTSVSDVHPLENLTLLFPACSTVWLDLSAPVFLFAAWAASNDLCTKKQGCVFREQKSFKCQISVWKLAWLFLLSTIWWTTRKNVNLQWY